MRSKTWEETSGKIRRVYSRLWLLKKTGFWTVDSPVRVGHVCSLSIIRRDSWIVLLDCVERYVWRWT
ncbi:hypothetical protein EUGRSUZ_J00423 [Eucalyptus grandis]|uniref:Uncharacterized protein n=2 Tax=Eucalyptus grandis TaxID=71139 RepID=A0ACC3J4K3_EUCGR|nr:hypothetical protein EUGRSUZ_J00423 [Eucalyptus grandis]